MTITTKGLAFSLLMLSIAIVTGAGTGMVLEIKWLAITLCVLQLLAQSAHIKGHESFWGTLTLSGLCALFYANAIDMVMIDEPTELTEELKSFRIGLVVSGSIGTCMLGFIFANFKRGGPEPRPEYLE